MKLMIWNLNSNMSTICNAVIKSGKRMGSLCGRHECKILHGNPDIVKEKPKCLYQSKQHITSLCHHINEKTPLGLDACRLFKESEGGDIIEACQMSESTFTLKLADGRHINVEEKGKKRTCVTKKEPWYGLQLDGSERRFSLVQKYSTLWYQRFVASGYITQMYGISTPIPSYDDWIKDVFSASKGSSAWTKEIRLKRPCGFSEERIDFVKVFNTCITDEDKSILANQVMELTHQALEKKYWVQIHSDLENDISDIIWTPQVQLPTGMPVVEIIPCKDVLVSLTWQSGRSLHIILRWGYNQGISNLRMDIK